ncbi:STAS domain-containing protein [Streptomyces sp. NPDC091272]|uniref:STAS domain-containing protein n=1 Tax=Streptomyces sp. NPDC091272 TaxID=3365981 RepID=UPI0038008C6D
MRPPHSFEPFLRLATDPATDGESLHLAVHGYLCHDNADEFLDEATGLLTAHPGIRDLHLDFTHLDGLDSMGLSVLLMLHRRTTAARVTLHLDARTPALERVLTITGALAYLDPAAARREQQSAPHGAEEAISAHNPAGGPTPRPAEPETTA